MEETNVGRRRGTRRDIERPGDRACYCRLTFFTHFDAPGAVSVDSCPEGCLAVLFSFRRMRSRPETAGRGAIDRSAKLSPKSTS